MEKIQLFVFGDKKKEKHLIYPKLDWKVYKYICPKTISNVYIYNSVSRLQRLDIQLGPYIETFS